MPRRRARTTSPSTGSAVGRPRAVDATEMPREELGALILRLEEEMQEAAAELRFEYAARLRDELADLKRELASMEAANV